MAYDVTEERLKVRGSEQITRDLKVGRDLFINGTASINNNGVLTTADKGVSNGVATLDATGRVPYNQLPESAMEYKGTWDASTNTPTLADGTGTNGDFYVVSAAGTVTFSAGRSITFYVNDRVIYDGTLHEWERLPAGEVRSVNGQTGDVTLSIPTVVDTVANGNMNAVTSNAVKTAIDNEVTARDNAISSAIATEVTNRNTAITNAVNALDVSDTAVAGQYVSAVSETDGKISVSRATLPTSGVSGVKGNNESTYRTGNVNLTAANIGAATSTDITNAINALDVSDSAVSGKYVSAVSETNGKITVTRANLPTDIDVSLKMDKANPTGTGTFSLNRKANTTVGNYSVAVGQSTTASGTYSHSEGSFTTASGNFSHAEGSNTIASGIGAHAEGEVTTASGQASHAEGNNTTASGSYSHAEGQGTIANGNYQHVQGKYNVDPSSTTKDWAFIIGGGTSNSNRKTILAFDWDGNLHIFGDLYVHCNANGNGGTKK